jgi:membrane-associated phospholipid phosphatase
VRDSKQENTTPQDELQKGVYDSNELDSSFMKNLWSDQKAIWSSPAHLRWADASWLFPMAAATGGLFATDRSATAAISNNPVRLNRYRNASDLGLASLVGVGGGLYVWGRLSHDDHRRETGILAGEAAIDSLAVSSALKYALGRERPYLDQGKGNFYQEGTSFPSDHSAVAWSIASVIAHEYPGPLTQLFAYGLAAGVSASRVAGKEHFPSDVLVGSAIGWLIGREVYRAHHDSDLAGTAVTRLSGDETEDRRVRQNMGSPFVPLDSWVYPALERLAALGYTDTAIVGLKPYTRIECARLTAEAGDALHDKPALNSEAEKLQGKLQEEFAFELNLIDGGRNLTANVESIYSRTVSISGPALTDSYHFGQTISNDFGRPFQRGTNGQLGGSFSAAAGPLAMYVRAEYQHAPSAPGFSSPTLDILAAQDRIPLSAEPSGAMSTINRAELLDAYASVNLGNWQLALGRQSLSWTPGPQGSMLWSDNIEPVDMVRMVNPEPFRLPGILGGIGLVRIDQFFGRLGGHDYIPRPFVYGQKISIKPFPFLELGFARRSMLGGAGSNSPLTAGNFIHNFLGLAQGADSTHAGSVPGDADTEMDWVFYVPKVGNYIVLYGDAYAEDDILPIENPARNPWHPGIYITRIPKIPHLDFHLEGVSTEQSGLVATAGGGNHGVFNYWNQTYRDGNTNDGFLIGNTVGRDGRSIQASLNYWFSAQNTLRFTYRHNSVSSDFLPGGGAWQDYSVKSDTYFKSGLYVKTECQYENISRFPLLFNGHASNFTMAVEVGFMPRERK